MERGERVTGLTRAVMYAGTPAVVASLWDVDDRSNEQKNEKIGPRITQINTNYFSKGILNCL